MTQSDLTRRRRQAYRERIFGRPIEDRAAVLRRMRERHPALFNQRDAEAERMAAVDTLEAIKGLRDVPLDEPLSERLRA